MKKIQQNKITNKLHKPNGKGREMVESELGRRTKNLLNVISGDVAGLISCCSIFHTHSLSQRSREAKTTVNPCKSG